MQIIEERNGEIYGLPCKEIGDMKISPLAKKIMNFLAKAPSYPKSISRSMRIEEQKIYYHIRNLEKKGLIKIIEKKEMGGAVARIYSLTKPAFFIRFEEPVKIKKAFKTNKWLEPFIIDGSINAKIIVGSPDPHGPEKARGRDIEYGMALAMFLGVFVSSYKSCVSLDTDVSKEDLKNNLIVIGGPITNRITKLLNVSMPVCFDSKNNIKSKISGRAYSSDDAGLVIKTENPFQKTSHIIIIAGKRHSGTKSAVLSFIKTFDDISKPNIINKKFNAHVVEGVDEDGDGIIDNAKVLE